MELNATFLILPGGWEWIIIVLAILLLFGGRKIPELMKGLGQGMKEFKKARNESSSSDNNKSVKGDDNQEENKS